jgi:hypothetical protein
MKRRVTVKGDKVRGSKEFGIVDYKRCLAPEIVERRILNHNRKIERDYQRYQVMGMRKGKYESETKVLQICNKVS